MATITLEVPDELLPQIHQLSDRFPDDHFSWKVFEIQGETPEGRVTLLHQKARSIL